MTSRQTGMVGETLAAQYYLRQGYTVLDNNYRTRFGELDIVLGKENTVVFAEVKTRGENSLAPPAEYVTREKQRRLILAAQSYIAEVLQGEVSARFDVVEVLIQGAGKSTIHCIENAFEL